MRFTVRSLGGKLVISAALMLLLCILLFFVTSWYVLKSYYEREAISDANRHIKSIQSAYQTKIDAMKAGLITEASKPAIVAALTTSKPTPQTSNEFALVKQRYHFSSVFVISMQGIILGDVYPFRNVSLISRAKHGETISTLQMTELEIATPITNPAGVNIGALVATQHIDDFVFDLSQIASDQPGNNGLNVALCE